MTENPADGLPLDTPKTHRDGDMLYRTLGRTGVHVSLIGLGGSHIGKPTLARTAVRLIRAAIDRGVTFLDNSWDYEKGASERRMGKALQDGYRDRVFLMTKIDGRTKDEARKQIEQSLKRLRTDRIDLLQHHEIIRMEDPDRIFAEEGAMEAVLDAVRDGKVRFVGFTGHKDPLVHLRMLDVAREHGFAFDTVQMPLNVLDAHFRSFGRLVLPRLLADGIGVIGMKSLGNGFVLKSGAVTAIEAMHYAMTLPTSTLVCGIDSMEILDQAIEAVRTFRPLSRDEVGALLARTRDAAASGKLEPFKTTSMFDWTAQHPQSLG